MPIRNELSGLTLLLISRPRSAPKNGAPQRGRRVAEAVTMELFGELASPMRPRSGADPAHAGTGNSSARGGLAVVQALVEQLAHRRDHVLAQPMGLWGTPGLGLALGGRRWRRSRGRGGDQGTAQALDDG